MKTKAFLTAALAVLVVLLLCGCPGPSGPGGDDNDPPEHAVYYHQWERTGRTITISANEFHNTSLVSEYKITNPTWVEIPLPDTSPWSEDLTAYKSDYPNGFELKGMVVHIIGSWPDPGYTSEYVFINKNDPSKMLWYRSGNGSTVLNKAD